MNPPVIPSKPEIVMPAANPQSSVLTPQQGFINTPPLPPKKNKKMFLAVIAVIILTVTTLSGFILIARPILYKSNAWNCGAYTFALTEDGTVTVVNGSTSSEPLQRADVYVNNQLVKTVDVPALTVGESKTLGTVTVPSTTFTWQINGTSDCSNSGRIEINTITYQCQNIKAYSEDGSMLYTATQLAGLSIGSKIRLVAGGAGTSTNYSGVRFTVNKTLLPASTLTDSNGNYYDIYTIPTGTTKLEITAELKGSDGNWY